MPKAEAAGALRNSELVQGSGPPFVCERFGFSATSSSLEVLLSCVGVAILDVKAFRNFRIKNGWKIKSVARYPTNVNTKFFDEPIVGTNNPFIHVEITGAVGTLSYFVMIEGPPGTDPYN